MRKMYFIVILLLLPAVIFASGTKGAAFLKIPAGSRPIALGEAYTALATDINSIYWNPGGLVYSRNKEVLLMRNFWLLGTSYNYLAFSFPSHGYGSFGLGVSYLGYGDFDAYDRHYQPQGNFSAYDMNISVSYSQVLTKTISLGANFKYIMEKIEESSGKAFGLDVGARLRQQHSPLTFAFVIKNIGTSMKLDSEGYPLPISITVGGLYTYNKLILPLDLSYSTDDGLQISLGSEYNLGNIMSIRGGYKWGATPGGLSGFRAGCGFNFSKLYIDYAFAPYANFGSSHIFTLGAKL